MSMQDASKYDEHLRSRWLVARQYAVGRLRYFDDYRACEMLGISHRTLRRDIERAKSCQTFDEWRPGKRGPKKGKRRQTVEVLRDVEEHVYACADQKRNVRKLGRDLELLLPTKGHAARVVPSTSTLERMVVDIEKADPAYFAEKRHGREGRAEHSLQKGSLEVDRPLQIVCIDHTPLDFRTLLIDGVEVVVRPTYTAAVDLYTSCCLAAFISAFPPSAITVSLAMAMMATPKTALLRQYQLPGEWEACGLPEILYVDGAGELTSEAVDRGCRLNGIDLRVGLPGRPERRARMERFWGSCNSEIHSWPGTTLSNVQELNAHGGQRPPAWNFDITQRQVLAMVMAHINETYGGAEIPPIMKWRALAGTARMARMTPRDPAKTFLDFLPYRPRAKINFQGIKLFNCEYRSGSLAALAYEGVKYVEVVYDPRDVRTIWLHHKKTYTPIPRVFPANAPHELRALQAWQQGRRQLAEEKKDRELLQKLATIRANPMAGFLQMVERELDEEQNPLKAAMLRAAYPEAHAEPASASTDPDAGEADARLPPDFTIPTFTPRVL